MYIFLHAQHSQQEGYTYVKDIYSSLDYKPPNGPHNNEVAVTCLSMPGQQARPACQVSIHPQRKLQKET
jgi:hypothetical protein